MSKAGRQAGRQEGIRKEGKRKEGIVWLFCFPCACSLHDDSLLIYGLCSFASFASFAFFVCLFVCWLVGWFVCLFVCLFVCACVFVYFLDLQSESYGATKRDDSYSEENGK